MELSDDCAHCLLESGVVEVYDCTIAVCRFGVPARAMCKLCGVEHVGVLSREPEGDLLGVPANRCPVCVAPLTPEALDVRACASCGARATAKRVRDPMRLDTLAALEAALDAWAEREGFATRDELVSSSLCVADVRSLHAALRDGRAIETVLDPFATMGRRTSGGSPSKSDAQRGSPAAGAAATETSRAAPAPGIASAPAPAGASTAMPSSPALSAPAPAPPPPATAPAATPALAPPLAAPKTTEPPRSAPPRAIVYPLVSVVLADGELHPEEQSLIDRFLLGEGLSPLTAEELRVHHPSEVAHLVPPGRRAEVVKLMCESAAIDGMPDAAERRVIAAYASAWGVDDDKVDFWIWGYEQMSAPVARQLWLKLRRFVLSARWEDET